MSSRSHLLYLILLPLLAQVGADDTEEEIVAEVMNREHELSSNPAAPPEAHGLPNPLPPSLLIHLLRAGAFKHTTNPFDGNEDSEVDVLSTGDVTKRVFCNGFTGCGGRHRDRSRRQEKYGKRLIPLLVKRPFCNNFGCYNGKRTPRAFTGFRLSPAPSMRARVLEETLAAASAQRGQPAVAPGKRLFCNGYGGCRSGKRSLFSNWLNKMNSVAAGGSR